VNRPRGPDALSDDRLSLLIHRTALWAGVFELHGYLVGQRGRAAPLGELSLRARRPAPYREVSAVLDVHELWLPGPDPDGLGLEAEGCYLYGGSWNAQLGGARAEDAERLDVDRAKPRELLLHRHPFGSPNEVREPVAVLPAPERWVLEIEELVFRRFLAVHDEED
jgi:hypothetical protein